MDTSSDSADARAGRLHTLEDVDGQIVAYYQTIRVSSAHMWVVVTDLNHNLVGKLDNLPINMSDAEIINSARSLLENSQ